MKKMRKIEKVNAVLNVLNTFGAGHESLVDANIRKELPVVQARVTVLMAEVVSTRDDIAAARARHDDSFDRIQRSIANCKRVVEAVAIRDCREVVIPRVSSALWQPTRITELAGSYLQAAAKLGDDPWVKQSAEQLKATLDGYLAARGQRTSKVFNRRTFKRELEAETEALAGKVDGYVSIIAYSIPAAERAELFNRIKAALPRQKHTVIQDEAPADAQTTTSSGPQPVALPAIPTMPTTPVPPSSEHPIMSANA